MPSGVWYCTAFGGHGLNTTAIGGKLWPKEFLVTDRYKNFDTAWSGQAICAGLAVAQHLLETAGTGQVARTLA